MTHNENTRVKIPALIHLAKLGYSYFSLKDNTHEFDIETNILKDIFNAQFIKINGFNPSDSNTHSIIKKEFTNISLELGQDDLGKSFYNRLISNGNSDYKLIDWEYFQNNTFHVCTELTYKNGEDEFRPDITIFINGLPLAFIEVKKPNNHEGIKAERDRINDRFRNEKFKKFINITQLLIYSNNMEYDDLGQNQLQGAFYSTTARKSSVKFNNFREELKNELPELKQISEQIENFILQDNNLIVLKHAPEFITNKNEQSPTNRILTSLLSKDRLKTLLQFGLTYVEETGDNGEVVLQKHIMRYPQFFACKAIKRKLEDNVKKGVIWHTQGSGKTALAYYSIRYLTDYFSKKGIAPKFYFIVDRLDLLKQSVGEFKKRGLSVSTVNSKEELQKEFAQNTTKKGITVINIQKFNEDTTAFNNSGYDIKVQRIYFIDEAHRSYDPKGSSLANLYNSDKDSVKIALTGTPLIMYKKHQNDTDGYEVTLSEKEDIKTTRNIFGDYIHKYYYNNSIKDGYTLKLLREEIETSYKEKVSQILKDIKIEFKSLNKKDLYANERFVLPMLEYIVKDLKQSRIRFGDTTIGGMVVCDSSEQAREMKKHFDDIFKDLTSALILHNENDKEIRTKQIQEFKEGKIDFLIVYSMLLTGFDAPRLKKLYLGRKIKAHNLLQTLTRVNRPYKNFRIGYVVDFADISEEFDITNKAYFEELNKEYDTTSTGESPNDVFGSLFMSEHEINKNIEESNIIISDYSTDNLDLFSQQITMLPKERLYEIRKALEQLRELYNIARLLGHTEVLGKIDLKLISPLLNEVASRIQLMNLQNVMNDINSKELLNLAIENVVFNFIKVGEEELQMLANDLQDKANKVRNLLNEINEPKDKHWITLFEEFKELLARNKIDESNFTNEKAKFVSTELERLYNKVQELNQIYFTLRSKFKGDRKFARIYKEFEHSGKVSQKIWLFDILNLVKNDLDDKLLLNENIIRNKSFFSQLVSQVILKKFEENQKNADFKIVKNLSQMTATEYITEYLPA
jgi:type I restriction enzyme R subunit